MEKIPKKSSCYTLNGSQPYVLTSNWPNGFIQIAPILRQTTQ